MAGRPKRRARKSPPTIENIQFPTKNFGSIQESSRMTISIAPILSSTVHYSTAGAHRPFKKSNGSPPSKQLKSVDSNTPPSIIRSSDMREGVQRPDDLAVEMREEGTADAMVALGFL